jgi:hypothetical protein
VIFYRFILFVIVCSCLILCGCQSASLPAEDTQAIRDFVKKETGERLTSLIRQADGDIMVQADITDGGFARAHFWLLKRTSDGWSLFDLGILSM